MLPYIPAQQFHRYIVLISAKHSTETLLNARALYVLHFELLFLAMDLMPTIQENQKVPLPINHILPYSYANHHL